jgi:two-component system chemotaxis response regulator CheB
VGSLPVPAPASAVCGVGIAASAGGLAALSRVLSGLPADFPACVLVVQHLDADHRSWMAEILRQRIALRVEVARGGERLERGTVFLAPPGQHLLVGPDDVLRLTHTSKVHFVRPSADLLFTSLAESLGARAVAVVLTGTGCDGAAGALLVKQHGGTVIVQDAASAEFDGMPAAARRTGAADRVLPLAEIAGALIELVEPAAAEALA